MDGLQNGHSGLQNQPGSSKSSLVGEHSMASVASVGSVVSPTAAAAAGATGSSRGLLSRLSGKEAKTPDVNFTR